MDPARRERGRRFHQHNPAKNSPFLQNLRSKKRRKESHNQKFLMNSKTLNLYLARKGSKTLLTLPVMEIGKGLRKKLRKKTRNSSQPLTNLAPKLSVISAHGYAMTPSSMKRHQTKYQVFLGWDCAQTWHKATCTPKTTNLNLVQSKTKERK